MTLVFALLSQVVLAQPIVLEGDLPTEGPDFVLLPFEVPEGIVEIEVAHPRQQPENVLDFGVFDAAGFRGWGGGNSESAVIGVQAASRSYLPGPIAAGTWNVVIGKAKLGVTPAHYKVTVDLRTVATLAPQLERSPFVASTLSTEARWYAGDFHVHSSESGDAHPTIDDVATFATMRGLDFVELSEHNTTSQLSWLRDVQPRHPSLLLLPGVEFTTYAGHANGIGATQYVDHRLGVNGVTIEGAVSSFVDQGAVFSINHPLLDLGTSCIGCAWKHPIPREHLSAVEVSTGGWDKTGLLFTDRVIDWWERLSNQDLHLAPVGGSDDHSGGLGTGQFDSPIGSPTTMVFATSLSPAAIVEGVRQGHTVLKLQGPSDPMIDLRINDALVGDTVSAPSGAMKVVVTNGAGATLVLWKDGVELEQIAVDSAAFTAERSLAASGRYRAEARIDGQPRTLTANLWLTIAEPVAPPQSCGCHSLDARGVLLLLFVAGRRRGKSK